MQQETRTPAGPTASADVVLPERTRLVPLRRLKTASGEPVVVQCERIDEILIIHAMQRLPQAAGANGAPDSTFGLRAAELMRDVAPAIIEAGTALAGPDGSLIRPAFWFTEPRPGALDGSDLRLADRAALYAAILDLSGFGEGPADELSFPPDRGGRTDGGGTVGPDEGTR